MTKKGAREDGDGKPGRRANIDLDRRPSLCQVSPKRERARFFLDRTTALPRQRRRLAALV
jgi:hypothetical protein